MNFKDLKEGDVLLVKRFDGISNENETIVTITESEATSPMVYGCVQISCSQHHYIAKHDVIKYLPKEEYPEYYL